MSGKEILHIGLSIRGAYCRSAMPHTLLVVRITFREPPLPQRNGRTLTVTFLPPESTTSGSQHTNTSSKGRTAENGCMCRPHFTDARTLNFFLSRVHITAQKCRSYARLILLLHHTELGRKATNIRCPRSDSE